MSVFICISKFNGNVFMLRVTKAGWMQPVQTPGLLILPVRPSEPAAQSSSCDSPHALLWKQIVVAAVTSNFFYSGIHCHLKIFAGTWVHSNHKKDTVGLIAHSSRPLTFSPSKITTCTFTTLCGSAHPVLVPLWPITDSSSSRKMVDGAWYLANSNRTCRHKIKNKKHKI